MSSKANIGWRPVTIMLWAVGLQIVASIILAVQVFFLHDRLRVHMNTQTPHGEVVISEHPWSREAAFVFSAVGLYALSFSLEVWANIKSERITRRRMVKLERRLHLVLEHVPPL